MKKPSPPASSRPILRLVVFILTSLTIFYIEFFHAKPDLSLRNLIKGRYKGGEFRFYRRRAQQQTKGFVMGVIDDSLRIILGPELEASLRNRWQESRPWRERIGQHVRSTYDSVPRADLILTAIGTASGVLLVRRAIRRFRTAQEIPLDYFRQKSKLRGYAVCVNDSDNIRFYHSSPLSSTLFRRPDIKRTDLKYETINVRLAGIDAPEMAHFGGECQPYAKEAKEWLTKFVEGKKVTIELFRFDQYSRAVAAVYVGRIFRKNVSVEMVKAGFATIYEDAGAEYGGFEQELRRHEKEAKSKRRGMWRQPWADYISPSQYKKALRSAQEAPTPVPATTSSKTTSKQKWSFWK